MVVWLTSLDFRVVKRSLSFKNAPVPIRIQLAHHVADVVALLGGVLPELAGQSSGRWYCWLASSVLGGEDWKHESPAEAAVRQ